jgi:hypothetical protein
MQNNQRNSLIKIKYMKQYKITFTNEDEQPELVKKWKGKKITLIELEKVINEFERIIFDGETIEVYNDYRE